MVQFIRFGKDSYAVQIVSNFHLFIYFDFFLCFQIYLDDCSFCCLSTSCFNPTIGLISVDGKAESRHDLFAIAGSHVLPS